MRETIALTWLEKERTHKYVAIDPITFGRIVLKHMGVDGECTKFERTNDTNEYLIKWTTVNGAKCEALVDYTMLMNALERKTLTITLEITD